MSQLTCEAALACSREQDSHVTIDPKTGQTKVEILRDDVLCH